ncbi:MAG: energy transducer TonB [Nitrospirae bacterium]|nr:energy transducer TonB [Nitrospirota bacterium]
MSARSGQTVPMAQSFALHAALAAAVFALGGLVAQDDRPVVIDFSLVEQCALTEAQAPQPPADEKREVRAQADARPPAPEVPQPPAPARAAVDEAQPAPAPEPDSAPLPGTAPAPPKRAYAPVRAIVRTRAAPAHAARDAGVADSGGQAMGGPASPGEAREGYLKLNFAYIRELVNRGFSYPPLARKMGWEGKVTVSFVVSRDGSVHDVRVVQSSGRDVLDRNAADTVSKASPFPAPPVEAEVVLPVVYRLN